MRNKSCKYLSKQLTHLQSDIDNKYIHYISDHTLFKYFTFKVWTFKNNILVLVIWTLLSLYYFNHFYTISILQVAIVKSGRLKVLSVHKIKVFNIEIIKNFKILKQIYLRIRKNHMIIESQVRICKVAVLGKLQIFITTYLHVIDKYNLLISISNDCRKTWPISKSMCNKIRSLLKFRYLQIVYFLIITKKVNPLKFLSYFPINYY